MIRRNKPAKPYPEFPLTLHPNGQWVKKVRGRLHYFGRDWQEALDLYLAQRDDLHAGRKPRVSSNEPTLALAMDQFLSSKKLAEQAGEISPRSYLDYEATCDRIAASIGADRLLSDIAVSDLEQLRADLGKGKKGRLSPETLKGLLTRARMVFLYVNENLDTRIVYRKALKSPRAALFRKLANERGPRMFEAGEINAMIVKAKPQLRAMIYLGINCGFGNNDCGALPFDHLDLDGGWHTFARPKTHNQRRCPLWPETTEALRVVIEQRPTPKPEAQQLVFVTHEGNSWSKHRNGYNSISHEFRKLLKELKIYRERVTFYSLRRTFETIGATAGEQVAVDYIMGHIGNEMSDLYRQKVFDQPLRKVTDHVRAWLSGQKIE